MATQASKSQLGNRLEKLNDTIKGRVLTPGDSHYDSAREIWNAMIDRKPAVIVQCADAADVPVAINFARENGLEIAIKGGGHSIAGLSVCDSGLVIDLSQMKEVKVDPQNQRATVQAGATLRDFDEAVQKHGLATPVGINSTTGIAGLTLGGGFGWLTRLYGMTIDNLLSAEVVTADGKSVSVSEVTNADLFWAIRGGGGNFGVVTQFQFQLHPVGPQVLAGLFVFPFHQAKQVLNRYREFVVSSPRELNAWVVMRKAPPLPFLPAEVHGKEVVLVPVFYVGTPAAGEKAIAPIRQFGDLVGEHVGAQPYVQWQQAFDPLLTPGARNYWKSHNFIQLSDGAVEQMIEFAGKLPSPHCEIFVGQVAGAANDVAPDATAYVGRDAKFVMNVHGRWDSEAQDEKCIRWSRDFFKATAPFASSGAYVNFMTAEEVNRVAAAYGPNYQRLLEVKKKYDPENIFRGNHNIQPESGRATAEKRSA